MNQTTVRFGSVESGTDRVGWEILILEERVGSALDFCFVFVFASGERGGEGGGRKKEGFPDIS